MTVTIDWDALRGALADRGPLAGGGRLGSGTPITPQTARRLACDATIIPAVLGSASEPLDLGRAVRLVSTANAAPSPRRWR